ncbi:MAG: hypothetical protein WEB89_00425 [Balneolales bacterium]
MLRFDLKYFMVLPIVILLILIGINLASAQVIVQNIGPDTEQDADQVADQDAETTGIFGIGAMIGEPTGGTVKYWLNPGNAFDASAGLSLQSENNDVSLHLGYLRHQYNDIEVQRGLLPYYLGVGGHARLGDRSRAGFRFAAGLTYLFENDPLEIYTEITPILELTPGTVVHMNYGVGIRYYPGQMD